MTRGKWWALLGIGAVLAIGAWWLRPRAPEPSASAPDGAPSKVHAPAPPPVPVKRVVLPIAAEIVLNAPDTAPLDDIGTLDLVISTYRKNLGANPVGENEEITAALLGANPKRLVYLPESGSFLSKGELVDRWGTPYFFHSVAADRLEIRSAGPDREMWTGDDVTPTP